MSATYMACPLCNKESEAISIKYYPCKCGDSIEVAEYVCFTCGCTFELVDGEMVEDPVDTISEVMHIMSNEGVDPEEFMDFIDNMSKELDAQGKKESSMSAFTHNCLKCSAPSFDDGTGLISCSKCDFEWEVISS